VESKIKRDAVSFMNNPGSYSVVTDVQTEPYLQGS